MIRKIFLNMPYFSIIHILLDILLVPAIFILAYGVKFKIGWILQNIFNIHFGKIYMHAQIEPYLHILWLILVLWVITLWYSGTYKLPSSLMPEVDLIINVIKGVTIGTLELMILSFVYKSFPGSRYVLFYAWGLGILILSFSRLVTLKWVVYDRINDKKVLMVGADAFGQDVIERIVLNPSLRLKYIGTVANAFPEKLHFHLRDCFKLLGNVSDLHSLIDAHHIDMIFVTDKKILDDQFEMIVQYCENHHIEIKILSDLVHNMGSTCSIEIFDGMPFEVHAPLKVGMAYYTLKRLFDFCAAIFILIVLSPVLLIIICLIKIVSPNGPIFYVQERVGENNRLFGMIKFRTMIPDAELHSGPVMVNEQAEDRYIPFGNLLRATSLDELPQLINVIKGDMSLVGPRPERPFFVDKFTQEIPYFRLRHTIKGGITGWAQINGRSVLTRRPEHKLKYDLYYIQNWSFLFDIKILIKTLFVVLKREEAY